MIKLLAMLAALGAVSPVLASTPVFSTSFDADLPSEISAGTAQITGVQGYAGYGPVGNQFGGSFLRSATGNEVTLTLNNLQAHSAISLGFLFAAIDSLDGTGTFPQGDFFHVKLDGVTIFRESFANAASWQIQSYTPPAGVQLARHVDLGFSGPGSYYTDSAYNLAADPTFQNIAHTSSSAVFSFVVEGNGIQHLTDESWAMDNLTVAVTPVPEPEAWAMLAAGLGLLGGAVRRRKQGAKTQLAS